MNELSRSIVVAGSPVHVVDQGMGQPVLFLHGIPDSSELWSSVVASLSKSYRCLVPDLPGFGRSSAPIAFDPSLDGLATFVDDLVEIIGIEEPLNLVAHDFGGIFGLAWAISYPTKVRSVVVGGCPFFPDYRWHFWARIWRTPWLGELAMLTMTEGGFRRELERSSRNLTREQIHAAYSSVTAETKGMILRLYRATDPENFEAWEPKLLALTRRVPTLAMWGSYDPYVSPRYAERFGAQRIEYFPNCGHWYPSEMPHEVGASIEEFLAADE